SSPTPFFDVRMRGFGDRTDVDDAVALIRSRCHALSSETVKIDVAAGRVLAADVIAAVAVPHFDRAAFDGYAVRAGETVDATSAKPRTLQVIGEAMPGRPFGRSVESGKAVRIMTGSPMPDGADAVLPAEFATEADGLLKVAEPIGSGKNVGKIGEDVAAGRTV